MATSEYLCELRAAVGSRLLMHPGVAALIFDAEGRILLIRRSDDGRWGLPAGAIDPGESPAQAVTRESREETGLEVRPRRIVGVFGGEGFRQRYENGDEMEYTVIVFACEIVGGELAPRDGEAEELCWFAPDGMPALPLPYPAELFDRRTLDDELREPLFG